LDTSGLLVRRGLHSGGRLGPPALIAKSSPTARSEEEVLVGAKKSGSTITVTVVRGAEPRWLTAAIKAGAKRDDFLVDKSAGKVRKKRRSKK
jgi:hypothetical protein